MAINKHDGEAIALWGDAYDSIPKSVFAVACWHFASLCGEDGTGSIKRMLEEVEALSANGIITEAQYKRVARALSDIVEETA